MLTESTKTNKDRGRRTHWSARQLATMALFIAMAVILSFIEFPLIPGIEFLKYDASAVPALLMGFSYGPVAGCIVGVLTAIIHALDGNIWGGIMNIGIVIAFVLPASLVYRFFVKRRLAASEATPGSLNNTPLPLASSGTGQQLGTSGNIALILGLVASCVLMIATAVGMNLVVTPLYMQVPREAVIAMLLPAIIPFNIAKALLNSALGFILLKSLARFIR
ncbi:MAG: ECF transporter S component [Coriobacteriales bacterium]|nr:ECF transporter S component [Coriobacteriales bacterium]